MSFPASFDPTALQQPATQPQGDITSLDGFDDLLSAINPNEPAPEQGQEQNPNPEQQNPDSSAQETGAEGTEGAEAPDITQLPHNKQNAMFAQMRIQNRQQNMVLRNILQKAGLDQSLADNPQQVLELLENAEAEQQAQQLQVPTELMQRLNYLERQNRETEAERAYQNAMTGFQEIQNTYQLNQQQLQTFAQQLQQVGIDPFKQQVDLMREFRNINYEWIVARERQQAMQEAMATQQKATMYSTTPNRFTGKPAATAPSDKIDTMAQFDKLIFDMNK